ncbi:DUF3800 domain-containing protein [Sulfurifustis variabilis]|uniref:DUF3800 domain-containing protein n=1 Tax=Sulfurifustis variabilis TaxID=1675686 RepID=UPI000BBADA8A|nr:DUF3800 domain-containing protein [Sulfurifustis variabilis]
MSHTFLAYIDESGDDGLKKFRDKKQDGSSQWLALGCCVVRQSNDLSLVKHRDSILAEIGKTKLRHVHFCDLDHHQKIAACRVVSQAPIRAISVLSNKKTVPKELAFAGEKGKLYWYLARHLVERVSWLCDEDNRENTKRVKIIFSNRSGLSYEKFREYLTVLKTQCETSIRWNVIDIDEVDSKPHTQLAGLQLADCIASGFAAAVEPTRYGDYEPRYAEILKPTTYSRKGKYIGYGLKILPNPEALNGEQAKLLGIFKKK